MVLGSAYACGSPYLNKTSVQCTVPQVSSVDVGQLLSVAVTVGGVTSPAYGSGLVVQTSAVKRK